MTSFALAVALSLSFQIAMMMWFFFCTHVEFSPYPGIMCRTLDVFGCAQSEGETGKVHICRFTFSKKNKKDALSCVPKISVSRSQARLDSLSTLLEVRKAGGAACCARTWPLSSCQRRSRPQRVRVGHDGS